MPRSFSGLCCRAIAAVGVISASALGLSVGGGAGASLAKSHSTTTTTTAAGSTQSTVVSQADTWLLKAIGAQHKVGSVRINATEVKGKTKQNISLLVNGDGEGSGTFVQEGSTIHLELVGPLLYFNAPKKYWQAHATPAQAAQFGGKWLEVSALDSRFTAFDEFFSPEDLVAAVFQGHTAPLQMSRPSATLLGHKVVLLSVTVTSTQNKKSTGKMWVEADGPPRALKIVDIAPGLSTTITFSHFGKAVSISTPPEPINLVGSTTSST